jgi:stage II sporulation protein D
MCTRTARSKVAPARFLDPHRPVCHDRPDVRPLLLPLALLALALPASAEEMVRIAVLTGARGPVVLEGAALRVRPLRDEGSYRDLSADHVTVAALGEGLSLDGEDVDAPGLRLRSSGPIRVAGKELRGQVEVLRDGAGLLVVNEIAMEDYLAAVLGSEMPPAFPAAALQAQAVAARTYAVRKKLEAEGKPFHLGATVLSQVYGGVFREDPRTHDAVAATRGEVLVFEHAPIEAYFFSSCGGRTEAGADALGRDLPYLRAVACDEKEEAPGARWSLALGGTELGHALGLGRALEVKVEGRTGSGRVRSVRIVTTAGTRTLTAVELRRRLGYRSLGSLWFDVERERDRFVFSGRGSGHGAGLCQWGARAMAEGGSTYTEILEHYYPGAELRRMY